MRLLSLGFACVAVLVGLFATASAQICRPVGGRAHMGDVGCWSTGEITQPQVFSLLDVYPTRATADAARGSGAPSLSPMARFGCSQLKTKVGALRVASILPK